MSAVDEPVRVNAGAAMVATLLRVAAPLVASSEAMWEFPFNALKSPTTLGRLSVTAS